MTAIIRSQRGAEARLREAAFEYCDFRGATARYFLYWQFPLTATEEEL